MDQSGLSKLEQDALLWHKNQDAARAAAQISNGRDHQINALVANIVDGMPALIAEAKKDREFRQDIVAEYQKSDEYRLASAKGL